MLGWCQIQHRTCALGTHSQLGIRVINDHIIQCIMCYGSGSTRSYGDAWQGHQTQTEMSREGFLKEPMSELKFEG